MTFYTAPTFDSWVDVAFLAKETTDKFNIVGYKDTGNTEEYVNFHPLDFASFSRVKDFQHHLASMRDANCFSKEVWEHFKFFTEALQQFTRTDRLDEFYSGIVAGHWKHPGEYPRYLEEGTMRIPAKTFKEPFSLKYTPPDPIQFQVSHLD